MDSPLAPTVTTPGSEPISEPAPTLVIGQDEPTFAWVVILNGPRRGRLYPLRLEGTSLGRVPPNDIELDDNAVSRFHARFVGERAGDRVVFFVQDLASANGTFVNGQRIVRERLQDEDRITVGNTILVFKQL